MERRQDGGVIIIVVLFAWLVPRLFLDVSSYRVALERSPHWKGEELVKALRALRFHSRLAICLCMLAVIGSAIGVALATRDLNSNMVLILGGLSRIASAVIVFLISLEVPQWLGEYDYIRLLKTDLSKEVGRCLQTLVFEVKWDILSQFLRIYFVLLVFFEGPNEPWSIPVAIIAGIILGVATCYWIYFTRTRFKAHKKVICYVAMGVLLILSVFSLILGLLFIVDVWVPDATEQQENLILGLGVSLSFVVGLLIHGAVYWVSHTRRLRKRTESRLSHRPLPNDTFHDAHFRPDLFGSFEKFVMDDSDLAPALERANSAPDVLMGEDSDGDSFAHGSEANAQNHNNNKTEQTAVTHLSSSSISANVLPHEPKSEELPPPEPARKRASSAPSAMEDAWDHPSIVLEMEESGDFVLPTPIPHLEKKEEDKGSDEKDMELVLAEEARVVPPAADSSGRSVTSFDELPITKNDDIFVNKGSGSRSSNGDDDGFYMVHEGDNDEEDIRPKSCCQMVKAKICCCACCHEQNYGPYSHLTRLGKFALFWRWFFRIALDLLCLYVVIVNIMATYQANVALDHFPAVHEMFYENFNEGPVCAFKEPYRDDLTQTFESPELAVLANYTIAHCGACAACSTWQNLRPQWTTRKNLANLASKCARKLIFGTYRQSLKCHMDLIGFDRPCSDCWIEDERCAIKNCAFINFQSHFINSVGNFAVEEGQVTTAFCDEAMCGPEFVPCSGATRRRMNIISDIARPESQQCTNVPNAEEMWPRLFGDDHRREL